MSLNKYLPHILVLPEDDANRQLARGFLLDPALSIRNIQVLPEAGGWTKVLEEFHGVHAGEMRKHPQRLMVLLIDFDEQQERLDKAKARILAHLKERVFILGAWSQPEALKTAGLGSYEDIGSKLAKDCREETVTIWGTNFFGTMLTSSSACAPMCVPSCFLSLIGDPTLTRSSAPSHGTEPCLRTWTQLQAEVHHRAFDG